MMDESREPRGSSRRAVSASCFRVISLQFETQNEVDVLKPVLEEMEVLRLSCALGVLPGVNPKDFEVDTLEPKDFDDEFARFLRSHVFRSESNSEEPRATVVGLFGKQAQVKFQLKNVDGWDEGMERYLHARDIGLFAVVLSADYWTNKIIAVFPWIPDEHFHVDRLRETPTYLLRLLTCLTSDITCCLAGADRRPMEDFLWMDEPMGDCNENWKSYSAAFRVEQEVDQQDNIRATMVGALALPVVIKQSSKVDIVRGSFPSLMGITKAPPTKHHKRSKKTFGSAKELCNWILEGSASYDVRVASSGWSVDMKEVMLRECGAWPNEELEAVEALYSRNAVCGEERFRDDFLPTMDAAREELKAAGESIFQLDELVDMQRTENAVDVVKAHIQELRSHPPLLELSSDTLKTLNLPVRLPRLMRYFVELFDRGEHEHLDRFLEMAPSKSMKEMSLNGTQSVKNVIEVVKGWFSSSQSGERSMHFSDEFRQRMAGPLHTMKHVWWTQVLTVMEAYSEHAIELQVDSMKREMRRVSESDRVRVIEEAFSRVLQRWSLSDIVGLSLKVSIQSRVGNSIVCSIEQEELQPSRDHLQLWSLRSPTFSDQESRSISSLGECRLLDGEMILGVYSIQTRSVLVVSLVKDKTLVRRVEFSQSGWNSRAPNVVQIRLCPRSTALCDFNLKERQLILVDATGKIGIYRLDEKFKAMETIRTLDAGLKTSLSLPLRQVMVSDGVLFMVDSVGAIQSLNIRNLQTSKKKALGALGELHHMTRLVQVSGGVIGWVEYNPGSAIGEMKFAAAGDLRDVPLCLDNSTLLVGMDVVYEVVEDSLFVINSRKGTICEFKLEASLRSESCRIQSVGGHAGFDEASRSAPESHAMVGDHWLWAFYHLYDKFPVDGVLLREGSTSRAVSLDLTFVCDVDRGNEDIDFDRGVRKLLGVMDMKLQMLNKPLYGLKLASDSCSISCGECAIENNQYDYIDPQSVATFIRELVTFVPMQICRAEFNSLTLMMDGQSKPQDDVSEDKSVSSTDIAMKLRFGLLSPLLASWGRQCVVITSMGKQSTGKSYFLNHLTGTSFAISGARCTDGAWMSVRFLPNGVMLVVIDFEGLGSFERTEQEDVFLSVLNASVSILTIFRMEMRLDKEIDDLFSKFQKGSQLIKNDPQLFRGKLYMSVKDVNPNDQKGVVGEFVTKFQRLLESNREQNFLTDMYAGQLEINCSPPLGTLGYYRSLSHVQRHIEKQLCGNSKAGFPSGKAFLDCVRLLLAKVSILDWTSLDESTLRMKIAESLKTLSSILRFGGVVNGYDETKGKSTGKLVQPDKLIIAASGEYITADLDELCTANPSLAAKWRQLAVSTLLNDVDDDVIDLGPSMELLASERSAAVSSAIRVLFMTFVDLCNASRGEQIVTKNQQHDFDVFLSFVIRRRCMRVQKWSRSVFGDRMPEAWNTTEQQALSQLQTLFVRCLDSCSECQLGCMKASTHTTDGDHAHDCATSHKCLGSCSYCSDPDDDDIKPQCSKPAGHDGRCECDKGDHTCGKPCVLEGASNCGRLCSKKAGHEDTEDHRCSVGLHKCGQPCLAPSCTRRCVMDFKVPHTAHKCEVDRCLSRCIMEGCNRSCSSTDHFHGHTDVKVAFDVENPDLAAKAGGMFDASSEKPTIHMCEEAHACPEMCGQDGICHIDVMLKQSSKTFVGARGSFQYTFQEMNGSRKKCARKLAPGQMVHSGHHTCVHCSHSHDGDEETKSSEFENQVIHYCDVRCPCCSYYCMKEHGHSGLHKTTHGNMRNTFFLSDEASIDLIDRKYTAGERGTAEMCNLYCSKMGRGHVHFLDCEKENANDECVYQGSREDMRRHCKLELEPKPDKEQDEVLHERFWDTLGWEDPCASIQEREEFAKCSYHCDAPDHEDKGVSYCVLPAWHELSHPNGADDGFTYVSGHKFQCSHVTVSDKIHHVFVLDASGSMRGSAWTRLNEAFRAYLQNRVDDGSTLDLVSVITFDGTAHIAWEAEPITAMTNAEAPFRGGGTSFSAALRAANEVISRMNFETYKPVVVFFSDGHPAEGHEGDALAKHIAETYVRYGLQSFAVGFGHVNLGMLEWLAELLGGSYCQVLTGDELKTTFHSISASLGTRAGLALTKPLHEMICVICQKELASEASAVLSPCHHELHQRCLRSLLESSAAGEARLCPTCRQPINVTA